MIDYDSIEDGRCYEVVPNELYLPVHISRGWVKCVIKVTGGGTYFKLYIESFKRHLMSAVYDGENTFHISNNERFSPDAHSSRGPRLNGCFAQVVRSTSDTFHVFLNECHYCDNISGHYSCGYDTKTREILGKIVYVSIFYL